MLARLQGSVAIASAILGVFSGCGRELAPENAQPHYAAARSSEKILSFEATLYFRSSNPTDDVVRTKIEEQVAHLFGPFELNRPRAVPKGDHTISSIALQRAPTADALHKVHYRYRGTILIEDNFRYSKFFAYLPNNPDTIYEEAKVGNSLPCTDPHYKSEAEFWYFWAPNRAGCKLIEGKHYQKIPVTLEDKGTRTRDTYPEYPRLVFENRIDMTLFVGTDYFYTRWNPFNSLDENSKTYKSIREKLQKRGFTLKKVWQEQDFISLLRAHSFPLSEIEKIRNVSSRELPLVEDFEKSFDSQRAQTVRVRLFFGSTGVRQRNKGFRHVYKHALEKDSVVLYAGHSGLGAHLDLNKIEQEEGFKIHFPTQRYQIYFFNSCTSYTSYTDSYFARKITTHDPRGTKNLDILANGIGTYFNELPQSTLGVIDAVTEWAQSGSARSYQSLAHAIDSNNLFGVSGDEDNGRRP